MTSNSDRLKATKEDIHAKLQQLEQRLKIMARLDERQTDTIEQLNNVFNMKDTGALLISRKNEEISKQKEDLVDTQKHWDVIETGCNDLRSDITHEKASILTLETQQKKAQETFAEYKVELIQIEKENRALKTQIEEMK